MTNFSIHLLRGGSVLALALATACGPAAAQTADGDTDIIVTGSRLGRTSFNSPTPVNQISDARMKDLAIPTVADALNQLPSFRASGTPTANLFRISGAIGANAVDLRGLGSTRTLTLLDGRRFVPSTDSGAVDLNTIPSALVQRTEVVTGGASAAYGANAVAGVVNLILDTKFSGIKTDINGGISEQGDARNYGASFAAGKDFAGERGHFVFGVEYQKNEGIGPCLERDFCARGTNYMSNPGYINGVSTNGLPATLVYPNVYFVQNPTGVLVSAIQTVGGVRTTLGQQVNNTGASSLPAALRNLQFNNSGTALVPFQFGQLLSGQFMQGGDPSTKDLWGFNGAPLLTPTWHASALAHADFDVNSKLQISGEFLYSRTEGGPAAASVLGLTPIGGTAAISINNPYITPAIRSQLLAVNPNITAINVNISKPETGFQLRGTSENDTYRGVLAAKGAITDNWKWDAYYSHGETESRADVKGVRLAALDNLATQAITPPGGYAGPIYSTPQGAPVICASSVASPSNGCVPVNFFGLNSLTPADYDRYFKTEWQTRTIKQDAAAFNVNGSLFDLGAGPVEAAVGVEWRRDTAQGDTDPITLAGLFASPNTNALPNVEQEVLEGYFETSVPLLRDKALAKSLTVDGAVRQTHYNTAGDATTWKLGSVYEPIDQLMFRVTRSHDIRAPTPAESNPNTTSLLSPLVDPFGFGTHTVTILSGGNPNLELETADTYTGGIVARPSFMPGFRLSADYYHIDVDGAIDALTAPNIMNACATQNLLCNLITFTGAPRVSPVDRVSSNFQNLSKLEARGVEVVGEYRIDDVAGGSLNLQVNANYVFKLISISGTGLVTVFDDVTGNAGALANVLGVPSYKIGTVVTYARPHWSLSAHGRYIPEAILDPTKNGPDQKGYNVNAPSSVNINTVDSRFYLDLAGTVKTGMKSFGGANLEIYGAVNNVFDTEPPEQLRLFGNPLHYDVIGRAYRFGVRTRF